MYMIVTAIIAMFCLGTRVVISKYCTKIVGTSLYVEINFWVDFVMGLMLLGLWGLNVVEM